MYNIKKLLYWLSKTDYDLVQHCPETSQHNQLELGLSVLLTSLLAFFSGGYLVYTIFSNLPLAISLGMVYSLIIMAIDRQIVSAKDKTSSIIRLPLAIVIGLFVSIPLELKIFEGRIDQELSRKSKIENQNSFERIRQVESRFKERKKDLENEISDRRKMIEEYGRNMEAEAVGRVIAGRTGIPGIGQAYNESRRLKEEAEKLLNETKNELSNLNIEYESDMNKARKLYQEEKVNQSYDLLSRYEALEFIKSNSTSAMFFAWVMRLFFMLIEVVPAILKLTHRYEEYQAWLETRTSVNIQKIHTIGNEHMKEIENEPLKSPQPSLRQIILNEPLTN